MSIGERIRKLREEKDMTLDALGKACGTTRQSIYKYEAGIVTNIPMDRVVAIAKALGTTPEYLLEWDKPSPETELAEYLEMLRTRPECRMLLDTVKGAKKEDVEENVRFIEALRKSKNAD